MQANLAIQDQSMLPIVIIGGGAAGLAAAHELHRAGKEFLLLEATDRFGGRLRTDEVDGFRLDHGFQVYLSAYPAGRDLLDYGALDLHYFEPGADIRQSGTFKRLGDPIRRPFQTLSTASHPALTIGDKFRVAKLRSRLRRKPLEEIYGGPNTSTIDYLNGLGFSQMSIDQFFRPFLGGVYLDESLSVSSRMFEFVWKFFSTGGVGLPKLGIGEIADQLVDRLPKESLRLQTTVERLEGPNILLTGGETIQSSHVIVATEANAAARLIRSSDTGTEWRRTVNIYYATGRLSKKYPALLLRGDETTGVIQTATILSDTLPSYAPNDQTLISVTVSEQFLDRELNELDSLVKDQLSTWLRVDAKRLRQLRVYDIPFALPARELDPVVQAIKFGANAGSDTTQDELEDQYFLAGDYLETPSLQGALSTGKRAAEAVVAAMT
ncbi:MAG: NAD(P)/FAD-dependent oxidoreductase [Planctomycetota bacterium]